MQGDHLKNADLPFCTVFSTGIGVSVSSWLMEVIKLNSLVVLPFFLSCALNCGELLIKCG